MATPGFSDIDEIYDPDVQRFSKLVKKLLRKCFGRSKSVNLIMRIVADSTWEHRRKQFAKAHKVVAEEDLYDEDGGAFNEERYRWLQNGYLSTGLPSILDPVLYTEDKEAAKKRYERDMYADDNLDSRVLEHYDLWLKEDGTPHFLTTQPYYVSKDMLRDLITHCDKYGIDFQIDAESFYFPGHTIRILFKKGEISPYDACAHEKQDV